MKPNDRIKKWITDPMSFFRDEIILENGKPLGQCWDDWQRDDFIGAIAHPNSVLIRPRGHDKTGMAGSMIFHDLVAGGTGRRIYSVASDQEQANLLLDDVIQKLRRNPTLAPAIKVTQSSVTFTPTGNRYETMASDIPSAFGLRPDVLVVDELAEWPARREGLWHALWSAMGKKPNTRTMVISSPGGELLANIRDMAKTEPDWFVSERGQCASWISPRWLAQQQKSLPAHVFARLHEGRWVETEGMYFTQAEVASVFQPLSEHDYVRAYAIGVDLAVSRDRAVTAAVGITASGLVFVESLYVYTPARSAKIDLSEAEDDLRELAKRLRALVIYDPYQAEFMAKRLRKEGITVVEYPFTHESRKRLFARLLDVIRSDALRSHPHDLLKHELLGLHIEPQGAGWRVEHAPNAHDDTVIAVGLGLNGLYELSADELTDEEIWGLPTASGIDENDIAGNFLEGW